MIMRHASVAAISSVIIVNAFLYLLYRDQTFVHIDAIAHVNKARGLFDNIEPGLRQLGTVWLPLPHILAAPLAAIDPLWRSGAAGSLLSVVCFVGNSLFLFLIGIEWTGSRIAGWLAFLFFAFNPHLIYLFPTPENEPLMILCITGLLYYLLRWIRHQLWKDLAFAALFAFVGTWTRYEGWAIAAAAVVLMPIITRNYRTAWIGVGGIIVSLIFIRRDYWRPTIVLLAGCLTIFLFYTLRYGAVMAATIPVFAALFVLFILRQIERRRVFSLLLLSPLLLPDPVPSASHEPIGEQFTITEEGDQLCAHGKFLAEHFVEIATAKTDATRPVHLYRNPTTGK